MSSSSRLFLFLDIFIAEVINLNVMLVTKMIVHVSVPAAAALLWPRSRAFSRALPPSNLAFRMHSRHSIYYDCILA